MEAVAGCRTETAVVWAVMVPLNMVSGGLLYRKVAPSPSRKRLLPWDFAVITGAEFSSEEGSDSLKRSEMS